MSYFEEPFSQAETAVLARFFTNTDRPVFALINLPETVKGALFARYSRSSKSLRRLFLDEFVSSPDLGIQAIADQFVGDDSVIDIRRAENLYQRVFFEYGDDSVAQLGGVHLACEQSSNLLTKVLEWGRLAAYLEQSTRYVPYDARLGERFRYLIPHELKTSRLLPDYLALMETLFENYSRAVAEMKPILERRYPRSETDSKTVWSSTIRAKALDTVRGLLPASTLSNVGIYADGQAYEMAMVRMQTHPLTEVRYCGASMLEELRKVIPSFLSRVDLPERGMAWSRYLADVSTGLSELASGLGLSVSDQPAVRLIDWDPDAEVKLAAAALFSVSELSEVELLERARSMKAKDLAKVFRAMVGERSNRRHKPGRAMERTTYRFEVICDFGAFRDLQRHRMMTVEWQRLSAGLGYETPPDLEEAGLSRPWETSMERAADLYGRVRSELGGDVAQYVVPLAYRIRFVMEMNPRQAMHLIELRTQPAGHPSYRAVCQEMHRQIRDVAGHRLIADAMSFVDYSDVELERLESERRAEQRRQNAKVGA